MILVRWYSDRNCDGRCGGGHNGLYVLVLQ